VVAAEASSSFKGIHGNEAEPQPQDVTDGDASALGCLGGPYEDLVVRGPGSSPPGEATLGDAILATRSLDIADPRAIELGLPGYPGASSPPANWMQVEGSVELPCSRVAATSQLL
jgi:hypothetical protein